MQQSGTLYLIPVTLGDVNHLEVLPMSVRKAVEQISTYIVENEKTARRFIKKVVPSKSQPSLNFNVLNKFTDPAELPSFLLKCQEGEDIGLMSEAGVPGVADPGADVVALAHKMGISVKPLVGPSSILLAVMASGMNGQSFAFNGYLPIDKPERKRKLKEFEQLSSKFNQTQVFIETPYRNNKLFDEIVSSLRKDTLLGIACDLTLPTEYIRTLAISSWIKEKVDLRKRPAIFLIHTGY
ncbi:SAM-dependent methyltransferase [Nonlabens spongiae]|uniref:SAM-dependent methyltransferase n=1 Tax=Nonlabens spongiae TaxID=331648 RepID=A0A1W6MI56_9FLAO|nr:SAM-dependent methyltransferase [Nonlabens spongiae]ARN77304.1 SAM-dependent methyltransferase [Nonlabens spongiae]